jgi:PKD domain
MRGIASAPGSTGISAARRHAGALVAALALAGVAGAAPTWTGPVELSPAERVVAPDLALNAAGDAVVVWNREEGEVCADAPDNPACVHVVEAISRLPGSGAWQPAVELARPGVGSGPRVAVDPVGNAVVVWSHDIGEPRVLQASYRRGRGGPWDFPIDLSDERFRAGTQQIGFDASGNAIAAWARFGDNGRVVQAAVRPRDSGIWGSPVDVSPRDASVVGAPGLAVGPGGQAVLAWVLASGAVQSSVWTGGWQAPVELGTGAAADVRVATAASGDAVAVWSTVRVGTRVLQAAFRPRGAAWQPAVDVAATGRGDPPTPDVALDPDGNAHAVWVGGSGAARLHASTRLRASSAWSPPVAVSPPNRGANEPRIALDATGNAVVAWTDPEGATRAAIKPASGPWQPAGELSGPNARTGGVRVDMGRIGAALAVWSRFEPRRVRVEASDLGGGGPVVGDLLVPARVAAGVPVTMTVGVWPWAAPLTGEPAWSFGDGTSARGPSVRHAYSRAESYTVVVTQADATGASSSASAAIVVSARPVANVRRPSIQGRPRVGATLVCSRGAWTGTPPIQYGYRWLRNGRLVPGATTPRFRARARDGGALVACRVSATNAAGSRSATSRPVRISGG